ncbi:MAG: DNA polymerase I [Candidatus Acidiferrales bacterium]
MTPSATPRLYLIDAMGYIFRAFYAPMPQRLRGPSGIPTNVPFLFATMVKRLLREQKPDYLAVVYDVAAPTFRDKLFAEYKAQRPPMPEDLSLQLPYVRRYCEAMRLPILEYPGYEADDVIGTLARQASGKKLDVMIVTSDKDLMQLVGGRVRLLNPAKADLIIDEKKVEELMGVPPSKVADVMALMGDAIDNIPGARDPNDKPPPGERRKPGIGDVGARQLIQEYGSAEEVLRHTADVKRASYREALEKNAAFVRLSKQLATIPTDAPVPLDLNALKITEPDEAALRALFTELGFTSMMRDLAPDTTAQPSQVTDYKALESPDAVRHYLHENASRETSLAAWAELVPEKDVAPGYGSPISAIEFSTAPGHGRSAQLDDAGKILEAIAEWRADSKRPKIVHDPKIFDLVTLHTEVAEKKPVRAKAKKKSEKPAPSENNAPPLAGVRDATALYSYLLRPTTANHAFPEVVLRHLNQTLSGAPGERADFLFRLAPVLRAEVEKQGLLELYEKIDLPLAPVLARMERHGVRVEPRALGAISKRAVSELAALEKQIFKLAGAEFKISSPQQLAEILFDKLNLPMPRRVRAKPRSTAAEVLEELARIHELPQKVMDYREISKLKSTYADVLPELIDPRTGRVHTRFDQTGTATGRLSSSNPNLQNIPIRTELGREIRAAFAAVKGNLLLSADYSQIELRLLAHFSEDPVLIESFRRGEDIHSRTAQEVFGVAPFAQTSEHRRAAKVINFGIIYGLSAFGLARNLNIDQKEAAKFIAAYFERYSGVKAWLDRQVAETRISGSTRTLFGRIRPIPEISSPQPSLRSFAERTAMNTPLQGSAADLIKIAMIEIDRQLPAEGFAAKMILQVHDELLFEAPEKEIPRLKKLVKQSMENVQELKVPLIVDVNVGPNWRDM